MERDANSRMETLVFWRPRCDREVTANIRPPDGLAQSRPRAPLRSHSHTEFEIEVPAHLAVDFGVAPEQGRRDHTISCQRSPQIDHPGRRRGRWVSHVVTQYAHAGTEVTRPHWRR